MLAATNRPEALDEAITRPGRFDRVINVPFPNADARLQILRVHSRNKRLAGDISWDRLARSTSSFSGADLMNLMNTSAINAARAVRLAQCCSAALGIVVHCSARVLIMLRRA